MDVGQYIGIGFAGALAAGWILVLLREFVAPWVVRQLDLRPRSSEALTTSAAPKVIKGVRITFGR